MSPRPFGAPGGSIKEPVSQRNFVLNALYVIVQLKGLYPRKNIRIELAFQNGGQLTDLHFQFNQF